jgi:hypothetical protein
MRWQNLSKRLKIPYSHRSVIPFGAGAPEIFFQKQDYGTSEETMAKKTGKRKKELQAEKRELAMIEGILEGSPDGIGVVVVRLDCGCRKMAAVTADGEPASKVIMYRDMAESICDMCKEDNGDFMRVTESFIHWVEPAPTEEQKEIIKVKVLGTSSN